MPAPTDEQIWPYFVLLCRRNPCRQEGMMRFRLKRDMKAASAAMEALGYQAVQFDKAGRAMSFVSPRVLATISDTVSHANDEPTLE